MFLKNKIVRKRKLNESTTKVDNDEKTSDGKSAAGGNVSYLNDLLFGWMKHSLIVRFVSFLLQDENVKRIKLEENAPENELNGSVNKSMEVDSQSAPETNCKGGSEQYDPENPESENEKETESIDHQLKLNHNIKESVVMVEAIKQEIRVEELIIKEEPIATPVKQERKPPGRSPGSGRGPRARRGRR